MRQFRIVPKAGRVYDSVVMSAVVALSGLSIERNRPAEFPDFTRGAWKTRKPYFALDLVT